MCKLKFNSHSAGIGVVDYKAGEEREAVHVWYPAETGAVLPGTLHVQGPGQAVHGIRLPRNPPVRVSVLVANGDLLLPGQALLESVGQIGVGASAFKNKMEN